MRVLIDIPEDARESIENGSFGVKYNIYDLCGWIMNGNLLPKGHGDLIDRSELYNQTANWESQALEQVDKYDPMYTRDDWRWWTAVLKERGAFKHDVADAKTIIPADKEDTE